MRKKCILSLQVQGIVQDKSGKTVATLFGKWDESMHYVIGDCSGIGKGSDSFSEAHLLWKRSKPPKYPTRYNFTRFAITLNELTPGLKVMSPPPAKIKTKAKIAMRAHTRERERVRDSWNMRLSFKDSLGLPLLDLFSVFIGL